MDPGLRRDHEDGSQSSRSVQSQRVLDVAEAGRAGAATLAHIHRMQLPLDVRAPEFEKAPQLGIIGREIEFLPDEALQQGRVVRQAIDDLCGREPVPVKLQLEGGHVSLVRSLSCTEVTSIIALLSRSNKKP